MAALVLIDAGMSESDAKQEAVELTAYWFKQGYWGIRTRVKLTSDGYIVKSNVGLNGFPPR